MRFELNDRAVTHMSIRTRPDTHTLTLTLTIVRSNARVHAMIVRVMKSIAEKGLTAGDRRGDGSVVGM